MHDLTMLCALLALLAGCGGRPLSLADASVPRDSQASRDRRTTDAAAPRNCTSLAPRRQVSLELADTMKLGPQIVFDGERFAVVWHSQPGIISSLNGELRFAIVDAAGKTSTPDGIRLGSDNGNIPASVTASRGRYAVLHLPFSGSAEPGLELRQIDGEGQTLASTIIKGLFYQATMTTQPSGHVVFAAAQSSSPELVAVDSSGAVSSPTFFPSAQVISSLWLALRTGGLAAAYSTSNSDSELLLLDSSFTVVKRTAVGHGAQINAPSFAVLPDGLAALYANANQLESEVYDSAGQPLGHHTLATAGAAVSGPRTTALVSAGEQLFALYPGAVSGQYVVQILEASGAPGSQAVPLPNCLAIATEISAAWGQDQLAVASINEASGVMKSSVCVTLMECR